MGFASATVTVFGLLILGLQFDSTTSAAISMAAAAISMAVIGSWGIVLTAISIHRSEAHLSEYERAHEQA